MGVVDGLQCQFTERELKPVFPGSVGWIWLLHGCVQVVLSAPVLNPLLCQIDQRSVDGMETAHELCIVHRWDSGGTLTLPVKLVVSKVKSYIGCRCAVGSHDDLLDGCEHEMVR